MKVALIGRGRWGKILLNELAKLREIKYQCDSKSDLNLVWNDPEVESVFIATPTETHFEIASKALGAGKNVFLEKPGTTSSVLLEKLVEMAESKNLKFAVGYEFPHHPAINKLKELIAGKEVEFIRLEYQKWGTFRDNIVTHFLCHDVSILKYLNIPIDSPRSNGVSVITDADILATRFGSRVMSVINRVSPLKQRTLIIKLRDSKYLLNGDELFEIVGEELKKIELSETTSVANELNDFLNSEKPLCSGKFALEIYRIIEQVDAPR